MNDFGFILGARPAVWTSDLVAHPYMPEAGEAVAMPAEMLWGDVPTSIALGRQFWVADIIAETQADWQKARLNEDYFVSQIEAAKDHGRYVVRVGFTSMNESIVDTVPNLYDPSIEPDFVVAYDARQGLKAEFRILALETSILDEFTATSVPPLGARRHLYRPVIAEHQTSAYPAAHPRNIISAVRMARDGKGLRPQAKSAKRPWETTHFLSINNHLSLGCGA